MLQLPYSCATGSRLGERHNYSKMGKVAERTDDQARLDLMTATTRKTRRLLLAVAVISLILRAYPGLQPTGVPVLGVKFTNHAQNAELVFGALFLFTLYLLISFAWYALRDHRNSSPSRLHAIILGHFGKVNIIGHILRTSGITNVGFDASDRLLSILTHVRDVAGVGHFKFSLAIIWACVGQAKNLLINRVIVFWVLDFWFPVLLGLLATRGNAEPAMNLVARVLAMF